MVADTPEKSPAAPSARRICAPTAIGPGFLGGAITSCGIATVCPAWNASAGRSAACVGATADADASPCSCILTLIKSSGCVEHPATMDAMPPSTNPLNPIAPPLRKSDGFNPSPQRNQNKSKRNNKNKTARKLKERSNLVFLLLPIGAGAHLTGNEEMGMEGEGYGGGVWDAGPL
uniref:Uncharacterized protein n=1 Tax=Oryza punctata TaxID=4537 RepID=A0A0E0LVZ6_ORYPU